MKREVSQEQIQIAAELEEIAQKLRQGKWEIASFTSAEEGVDPVQCFASILRGSGISAQDEDPEEVMRENLDFLSGFPMYAFFLNKHADPTASRTSVSRWTARKPEAKPGKRLSPSQARLAQILGMDAEETLAFMQQAFRLAPKGTRLGEIAKAVQSLTQSGDQKPTPEKVAAVLKSAGTPAPQREVKETPGPMPWPWPLHVPPTPQREVKETEKKEGKKRKHVSVWEIRN